MSYATGRACRALMLALLATPAAAGLSRDPVKADLEPDRSYRIVPAPVWAPFWARTFVPFRP
jgi:hypothetical protein